MPSNAPIATGFTAEVFDWKPGWVLKLFNQGIARSTVEAEASAARLWENIRYDEPRLQAFAGKLVGK